MNLKLWIASYEMGINPFEFYATTMFSFFVKFPETRNMSMPEIYNYLKNEIKES